MVPESSQLAADANLVAGFLRWGGRLVWQVTDSDKLLVAWRKCARPGQTARALETELLEAFRKQYRSLPFANLAA